MSTLAQKITALLDRPKPGGEKYTMEEIVAGTGEKVSRAYLWKLKTGQATNPSLEVLEALAKFFEVTLDYFSTRTGPLDPSDLLVTPAVVEEIALRASTLSKEGQKAVLDMVRFVSTQAGTQDQNGGAAMGEVEGGADEGTPSGEGE